MMKKKTIIISLLVLLIPLMAVGYAILNESLIISGTSHIDSNWQVEIISITESDIVGDATDKVTPSYTATTANFRVGLINPTDSITYNIKIKNLGNLEARIKNISVNIGNSDAIEYEVNLVKSDNTLVQLAANNTVNTTNINNTKNTVLPVNGEQIVKLKVSFKEGYIGQPSTENSSNNIRMTIDYVQNFKDSNGNQIFPAEYPEYSVGDTIVYGGTSWYVIAPSSANQDYVTLLKVALVTNVELTDNYRRRILESNYNTTTPNMAYYWSSTCHNGSSSYTYYYGQDGPYNDKDVSGCINNYSNSKIKEYFDNVYSQNIDPNSDKLKEVDGYKIRLLNNNDLEGYLGYVNGNKTENTPTWVYEGFGSAYYWTMVETNTSGNASYIENSGMVKTCSVNSNDMPIGLRPVINLYKNLIDNSVVAGNYTTYSIGDTVSFSGSNWYVIEDSTSSQDYVTLLKDAVLTASELTNNYSNGSNAVMAYYWSDTCHKSLNYGSNSYSSEVTTGCANHNDYAGSKIKEMLEGTYMPTLGANKLKEVNGYKIRLLNLNDLQNNLGWYSGIETNSQTAGNNVPSWIHKNLNMWTMIPDELNNSDLKNNSNVYRIKTDKVLRSSQSYSQYAVRPVINLYKEYIEENNS